MVLDVGAAVVLVEVVGKVSALSKSTTGGSFRTPSHPEIELSHGNISSGISDASMHLYSSSTEPS